MRFLQTHGFPIDLVKKTDAMVDTARKRTEDGNLDVFRSLGQVVDLLHHFAEIRAVLVAVFSDSDIVVLVIFLHIWSQRVKITMDQVWELSPLSVKFHH